MKKTIFQFCFVLILILIVLISCTPQAIEIPPDLEIGVLPSATTTPVATAQATLTETPFVTTLVVSTPTMLQATWTSQPVLVGNDAVEAVNTISSSRNGLNMVNLVPTKETNVHVQAYRQD